jgi:hypothetical protein
MVAASSPEAVFTVAKMLTAPQLVAPGRGQTVNMQNERSLVFSWKPSEGANKYRLRLFQVAGGVRRQVMEHTVTETEYRLTNLELLDVGDFMWEVVALRHDGDETSAESTPAQQYFSITLPQPQAPVITSPNILYVQ